MARRVDIVPVWQQAREYTGEALEVAAGLMRDEGQPGSTRLGAAGLLLDRGWGKAPIMVAGDADRPIRVDVRAIPADTLASLEAALVLALGEAAATVIEGHALPHTRPSPPQCVSDMPEAGHGAVQHDRSGLHGER